jgi:hypothetical protein
LFAFRRDKALPCLKILQHKKSQGYALALRFSNQLTISA